MLRLSGCPRGAQAIAPASDGRTTSNIPSDYTPIPPVVSSLATPVDVYNSVFPSRSGSPPEQFGIFDLEDEEELGLNAPPPFVKDKGCCMDDRI